MSVKSQIKEPLKGLSRSNSEDGNISTAQKGLTVELPRDMYAHTPLSILNEKGCPTEWWWHIGTLNASGGRAFGFEINAAALYPGGFTEVMLTDLKNQIHYHQTQTEDLILSEWAETDVTKPWFVKLKNVSMKAPQADPTQNMSVTAVIEDKGKKISFDLTFSQEGLPLMVWGNGVEPNIPDPQLYNCNFYFSLTRLKASGTIVITDIADSTNTETHEVTGTTWMDHEWGKFGSKQKPVKWILQDIQLDNGVCLSNFSTTKPVLNTATSGKATVQLQKDGASYFVDSKMTPTKSKMIGGVTYFTEVLVEIPEYGISAVVKSLMPDQVFEGNIYEGVGSASGTMMDGENKVVVSGTAWIEQSIK
ncbi:lipocalin-like domain-containing protein [uncultured Tenacibaculum sp.]|uniref:lipocalin-like domain-containing protein n=1 Tax=uncultured Tenacibaculum sp. TaxID=174713 RepID=UPI002613FD16|nr:lipocalin-like domain-containing protein [uncultured Tenacibaculum sp.]